MRRWLGTEGTFNPASGEKVIIENQRLDVRPLCLLPCLFRFFGLDSLTVSRPQLDQSIYSAWEAGKAA